MPGVDFNVLRAEITMEQVLNQPGFQPTSTTRVFVILALTLNVHRGTKWALGGGTCPGTRWIASAIAPVPGNSFSRKTC